MVPVVALAGLGIAIQSGDWLPLPRIWGAGFLGIAFLLLAGLIRQIVLPRVAYRDGQVLFYLTSRGAIAVPVQVVEAFFQGEGLAHLPGEARHQTKSVNLVARLSQRATEWQQQEVKPALGRWADGYVTVRGPWCEPINGDVIRRLNRRLGEVTRAAQPQTEGCAEA